MANNGEHLVQELYAAAGDCRDGALSEEKLLQKLEEAGHILDERQQRVVESILSQK
jgi:hypothetical protein